jgi:FMN phosphatase YigB (HAD superfamily)
LERWDREIRVPAWTGQLSDDDLWSALSGTSLVGGVSAATWSRRLERHYAPGPAAEYLPCWSARVPIWLLSNHRSHWLLPRLERFGALDCVQRVLVSDDLRAVKPDPAAFLPVLGETTPERVLFVDDQVKNIRIAASLGMRTVLAETPEQVGREVEHALAAASREGALR